MVEVKKDRIWQEFQKNIRKEKKISSSSLNLGWKFQRRSDLFLKTSDFNEKTLQKIGNGNFGIVFKVELYSQDKIVAVKKTTHVWNNTKNAKLGAYTTMKMIIDFIQGADHRALARHYDSVRAMTHR